MGKSVHNDVLDASHNEVKTNATLQIACSAEPTTRTEAVTTYALADVAVTSSDFTNADGDTSGRKCTLAQKTGATVDTSGTATHIAIVDGTRLLRVTTCTSQALTAGNDLTFNSWKFEIGDPS